MSLPPTSIIGLYFVEQKSAFEAPAFESADVPQQLKTVVTTYERLLKKPKPAPPKVCSSCLDCLLLLVCTFPVALTSLIH